MLGIGRREPRLRAVVAASHACPPLQSEGLVEGLNLLITHEIDHIDPVELCKERAK